MSSAKIAAIAIVLLSAFSIGASCHYPVTNLCWSPSDSSDLKVDKDVSRATVTFSRREISQLGTWESSALTATTDFWASDVMPDGTTMFVSQRTTCKVYKSLDEGLTWTLVFTPPQSSPKGAISGSGVTFCDSLGNIFVSPSGPEFEPNSGYWGLYRSGDGGSTWQHVWEGPNSYYWANIRFAGMCEVNDTLYFGESVYSGGDCYVFRSTDHGLSWQKISEIPNGKHVHALQYNNCTGWFYASVGDGGYSANGLWRSKDNCLTWQKFYLPDWTIMSVGFYNDYIFCNIHHEQGQIRKFRDTGGATVMWEEVFRSNVEYQNWCQIYQRGGKTFMISGGQPGDVGISGSEVTPFNYGTWQKYVGGYGESAVASLKPTKNGWLVIGSTSGGSYRVRYVAGEEPPLTNYTLTVTTSGSGSVDMNPDLISYQPGTNVTLAATPNNGWSFAGWSGALSGLTNPTTITMNGNKTVIATFTQNPLPSYTLTISIVGNGTVTTNPNLSAYQSGTVVTLTQTPAFGWKFDGWSGDLSGTSNQTTITMNSNKSVVAIFTASFTQSADLNQDGTVNIIDVTIVATAFGSHGPNIPNPGDPQSEKWNATADLDKNGLINIVDVTLVAKDYDNTS